jgi:hypothetical protein
VIVDVGGAVIEVSKAVAADFTDWHDQQLAAMTFADRLLHFPDPRWRCAWARFQWRRDRRSWLDRPLTAVLRIVLGGRYEAYQRRYRDVHERNVLFEVRPLRGSGVPGLARDAAGRVRLVRVGLQPVDLR